jgi:hypothetical protein
LNLMIPISPCFSNKTVFAIAHPLFGYGFSGGC